MFCAQRQFERRIRRKTRRILRIVFLLFANHCLKLQNKKSIEGARRQIYGSSNQNALSGPTSRIVPSDRSGRTNKLDRPIRSFLRTYFLYLPIRYFPRTYFPYGPIRYLLRTYFPYGPIRSLLQTYFCTGQSDLSYGPTSVPTNQISPTGLLPYQPIRSLLRAYFCTSRSDLSYGPTSVPANQISPTDLLPYQPIRSLLRTYIHTSQSDRTDGPTFRTSQSDRTDGPNFRTSQSDCTERHRLEFHQEIKSLAWSQTAQVTWSLGEILDGDAPRDMIGLYVK